MTMCPRIGWNESCVCSSVERPEAICHRASSARMKVLKGWADVNDCWALNLPSIWAINPHGEPASRQSNRRNVAGRARC